MEKQTRGGAFYAQTGSSKDHTRQDHPVYYSSHLLYRDFTVAVCSFVFQSLLKRNQIQSAEYSLRIICDNTAGDLENILSFTDGAL